MKRLFKYAVCALFLVFLAVFLFSFVGTSKPREDVRWGVNFSPTHAAALGLDPRATYRALLDELGVKRIKLALHWDALEPKEGVYTFTETDWMLGEAAARGAKLLLVVGMKTPRWPECHLPLWAKGLNKSSQEARILSYLEAVVERYRLHEEVWGWQVENEPFFSFGECPWRDEKFLEREVARVKELDPGRPVVVSESGEFSFFLKAARSGDVVGTTLYRNVWFKELGRYFSYPFPPVFYERRASVIRRLFGKEVINVELQAEPWGPTLLYDLPLEEQKKTMTLDRFRENVEFAKRTRLPEAYLWGAEWWFWLKEAQGDASFWEEAKALFSPQA